MLQIAVHNAVKQPIMLQVKLLCNRSSNVGEANNLCSVWWAAHIYSYSTVQ